MSKTSASTSAPLEKAVFIHSTVLLLCSAWIYGGNIWWMRIALSLWTSLGAGLTLLAFCQRGSRGEAARRKIWWLTPLALFSGLILLSVFNPSFRTVHIDDAVSYVKTTVQKPHWPSTISTELTLRAWWFGAGVYLSAFNIVCLIQSRSILRKIMVLISVSTLLLAVMGTLQKLSGVGFYFGATESPNPRFFATFIYYNHWGAFMLLGLTTAIGLLFYHARRYESRDLWHSPFSAALVGVLLIATSAPVSASRASTVITALVLAIGLTHALSRIVNLRRARRQNPWPLLLTIITLAVITSSAISWLSYQTLTQRFNETQLAIDQNQSVFGGRAELYRDTWSLAKEKPVFGWGLDTYSIGFQMIRPYTVNLRDRSENIFATAHNDWLQSLAENGFAGTILLMAMGLIPLIMIPTRQFFHPLVIYPLLGCALLLLYALVEFPFANGAVMITFWTLLFTTVAYARLTDTASRTHHE
ncbi:O-antigen ligase family protein [Rariglobus hedericola]|nr:O-antigen ligase family protein [Rariglobus hedericola]